MAKVLGLDPGGTTGWALYDTEMFRMSQGELGPGDHHAKLNDLLGGVSPFLIICERFEHRNNDFASLVSVEYVGVVKRYAQASRTGVLWQGASQAKTFATDDKLERLGWLSRPLHPHRHMNDAKRHILYALCASQSLHDGLREVLKFGHRKQLLFKMLKEG